MAQAYSSEDDSRHVNHALHFRKRCSSQFHACHSRIRFSFQSLRIQLKHTQHLPSSHFLLLRVLSSTTTKSDHTNNIKQSNFNPESSNEHSSEADLNLTIPKQHLIATMDAPDNSAFSAGETKLLIEILRYCDGHINVSLITSQGTCPRAS